MATYYGKSIPELVNSCKLLKTRFDKSGSRLPLNVVSSSLNVYKTYFFGFKILPPCSFLPMEIWLLQPGKVKLFVLFDKKDIKFFFNFTIKH